MKTGYESPNIFARGSKLASGQREPPLVPPLCIYFFEIRVIGHMPHFSDFPAAKFATNFFLRCARFCQRYLSKLHTSGNGVMVANRTLSKILGTKLRRRQSADEYSLERKMARDREMVLLKYASRLRKEHPYWSLRRISVEISKTFKKKNLERPLAPEMVQRKLMRFFTTRRRIVDRVP